MELGALVCTPRNAQCLICPVKKLCVAFKENRVDELPNLGKRETATARHFIAFAVERDGKFLVQQRPAGVVNAQLWEFPNLEVTGTKPEGEAVFHKLFDVKPKVIQPLRTVKHSITRYRIKLEAFYASLGEAVSTRPHAKTKSRIRGAGPSGRISNAGCWIAPEEFDSFAFSSAHKKLASAAAKSILSGR
jgi:A/G-specific adenine glycosylase